MTSSGAPGTPGVERYPGEALDLLRSIHHDMAELRELRDEFGPLLDSLREGRGLLGMARAAARARNGARPDDPTNPAGPPGATIPAGIWGRARVTHRPGPPGA